MIPTFKYPLGAKARDVITGFEGRIISRTEHVTGCFYYGIQPPLNDKGEIPDVKAFDEPRIEVLDPTPVQLDLPMPKSRKKSPEVGGPREVERRVR